MHVHGVLLGPDGKELFSQSNPGQVTLTGSNVVQVSSKLNVTVTAGSTSIVIGPLNVSQYAYVAVLVLRDATHTYDVVEYECMPIESGSTVLLGTTLGTVTANFGMVPVRPKSNQIAITINNKDTVNHVYSVYLIGYKI